MTGAQTNGVLNVSLCFVKSPVFPFAKFPGVDPALGPEMRSTGEVMGVGDSFGEAFAKAQLSAGTPMPDSGMVFISVNDRDKPAAVEVAKISPSSDSNLVALAAQRRCLKAAERNSEVVFKVNEGRPDAVDLLKARPTTGDLHHDRRAFAFKG